MNIKFIEAKQAREVFQYHNIKRKLYRTTAAIWYNKTCRDRQLTPKCISIRVNGNNKQSLKTLQNATRFRINQEIKFLYIKKQKLTQKELKPPTLKVQIKLHKPGNPIRPVINNTKAPTYNIAKHLIEILNQYLTLTNQYNVKNSTILANDLTKLKTPYGCTYSSELLMMGNDGPKHVEHF
jgi:hypothetical protein